MLVQGCLIAWCVEWHSCCEVIVLPQEWITLYFRFNGMFCLLYNNHHTHTSSKYFYTCANVPKTLFIISHFIFDICPLLFKYVQFAFFFLHCNISLHMDMTGLSHSRAFHYILGEWLLFNNIYIGSTFPSQSRE